MIVKREILMDDLVGKWATNENLLQSYRLLAVASQSFLLAVGAFLANDHFYVFLLSSLVALTMIWAIWYPVVVIRHRIVDYYKYATSLDSHKKTALLHACKSAEDYATQKAQRSKANRILDLKTNWRVTRIKLDWVLPIMFSLLWIALAIDQIASNIDGKVKKLFAGNSFSTVAGAFLIIVVVLFILVFVYPKRKKRFLYLMLAAFELAISFQILGCII
jgi:hypothetical protein